MLKNFNSLRQICIIIVTLSRWETPRPKTRATQPNRMKSQQQLNNLFVDTYRYALLVYLLHLSKHSHMQNEKYCTKHKNYDINKLTLWALAGIFSYYSNNFKQQQKI